MALYSVDQWLGGLGALRRLSA